MDYVVSMLVNRPYVVCLVLTFMVVAAAERGWLRMTIWLVVGTFIGWLAEFTSTRTGFPFSWYEYYPANFANELWLGGIPLFASLSFAAMSYFGHSVAYTLLSPLHRGSTGIERPENVQLLLLNRDIPHKPAFNLPQKCLWRLGYFIGNYLFILFNVFFIKHKLKSPV